MEEIKVTEQAIEATEEITKAIDWKSIGKKGGTIGLVCVATYFGVKHVAIPLAKKIFKKDTNELEEADVEEIEVTELASEDEEE